MVTPKDLLSALARAYTISRFTPEGDSDLSDALERVRGGQAELGWVVFRVGIGGFTTGGEKVRAEGEDLEQFHESLEQAGIQEIRLQSVIPPEVFLDFFHRLSTPSVFLDEPPSAYFRGLQRHIGLSFQRSDSEPPGMVGAIQRLFAARADAAFPASEEFEGKLPEAHSAWTLQPEGAEDKLEALDPDDLEQIGAYLVAGEPDRTEWRERILARGRELEASRKVRDLSGMVELLIESGGDGPGAEEAIDLGRELASPLVASHLVARLGGTKDIAERERLTKIIFRIGREGALALSDALGEARDRSQRRAFMDALGAMGPFGLERAQRMVEDPRWFVVRNGAALLGDLGGEDTVSYLTATLAATDARVRKESVRSLAKLGGRDAEMLVTGMLADGDPAVRAAACQALGVLKSSRSVQPLVDALKDESPDVQIESLRALGRIGDPGVVRTVEKKAFGGLFSKGTAEIRIAAFRALAGIGTHGALRALEKGANDSDPTVRTVVRALIDTD
ncbi:MAG: HEAT repeat domain-containing protein [Gemmatimonadota bacterium]|jgi:hypothetical protein